MVPVQVGSSIRVLAALVRVVAAPVRVVAVLVQRFGGPACPGTSR